jgi:integrase
MTSIRDLYPLFLEELSGQSAANRRNYRTRLALLLEHVGDKTAVSLTAADINAWHAAIISRGYQPATEAGYRQAVKSFCNWLVRRGEMTDSPAAHLRVGSFISKRRKLPAEADVQQCLAIATIWSRSQQPLLVRDGLIWLISYTSGCRLREIRELRLDEVEAALQAGPDEGAYWVRSHGKTGEVQIGFTDEVACAFGSWLALRPSCQIKACFIGTRPTSTAADPTPRYRPLSRESITDAYRRVSKAAGLKRPILSHALRHRKGDLVTRQHGPKIAAAILNHADRDTAATAIAYYHHPDQADANRAIAGSFEDAETNESLEIARLFNIIK